MTFETGTMYHKARFTGTAGVVTGTAGVPPALSANEAERNEARTRG